MSSNLLQTTTVQVSQNEELGIVGDLADTSNQLNRLLTNFDSTKTTLQSTNTEERSNTRH